MKSLLKSLRFLTAAAGAVAVLAMSGAVQGFASCDCPDCRQVGPKCYEGTPARMTSADGTAPSVTAASIDLRGAA
jgi:hypothetical protein